MAFHDFLIEQQKANREKKRERYGINVGVRNI